MRSPLDSGGFRQTIDGWNQDGGLAGFNAEMRRFGLNPVTGGAGRFRAARRGSVTGIVITSDALATQGTLTAEVYINTSGTAGGPGAPTGLSTSLSTALPNPRINFRTQASDLDI